MTFFSRPVIPVLDERSDGQRPESQGFYLGFNLVFSRSSFLSILRHGSLRPPAQDDKFDRAVCNCLVRMTNRHGISSYQE
ncbi:MAG: hypothetical protein RLP11_15535 [Marinoscillum sp.]|uniref:hypothetical protein n=1 Tax=Marinoscillum sp. TaxID=2024838 RepID=UPI0032FE72FF